MRLVEITLDKWANGILTAGDYIGIRNAQEYSINGLYEIDSINLNTIRIRVPLSNEIADFEDEKFTMSMLRTIRTDNVDEINNATKQVAGWGFPHNSPYPNLGNDMTKFRMTIADIQKQANVQYKFPTGAVEVQPGKEWPVDFGALTNAKRAKCGKAE